MPIRSVDARGVRVISCSFWSADLCGLARDATLKIYALGVDPGLSRLLLTADPRWHYDFYVL